ncbi:MAG TPA: 2-amino-4-hydroxy-6-hydroxymethyldihydropteridine diphosphokinase [Candidatus Coprenecus stercoravium]|uniref:2-amino-4-hydroxy-6-hydroxymethyldihydropteridine pyrophosphokinase n=1 Tax=Candidatus Coprenecus stercoravium TaxID=2840735 RepID=A0A9D2GPW9_9BACT|nr:2-amino-4-hydroxy-6-hydroxymethyldihydropteridine diphosphokinase [Candidatus Coprenecus stercoravium]
MTPEKEPVRVYLLLGSNMGDRRRNLSIAVSLLVTELAPWLFSDVRESQVLETEPFGMPQGTAPFMNQAVSFETTVPPEDLLKVCKWVEHKLGRPDHGPEYDESGRRIYHSRIIDIDIALYGDRKIDTPQLTVPHPQIEEREYAKRLLNEII